MSRFLAFITLWLSTFCFASGGVADTRFLEVPVQFVVVNGNYDASVVYIRKAGETIGSFKGQKNMRLKMEYDSEYQLDFTKPGYITKSVKVTTAVPPERKSMGFESYKIGVRLFKQYDGVNIVVYNQPVASIRYLPELDEFSYDTDYTKSILSLLSATEEILEKKAREEAEAGRSNQTGKANAVASSEQPALSAAPEAMDFAPVIPPAALPLSPFSLPVRAVPQMTMEGRWPLESTEDSLGAAAVDGGEEPSSGSDFNGGADAGLNGGGEDGADKNTATQPAGGGFDVEDEMSVLPRGHSIQVNRIREKRRTITVLHILDGGKTREYKRIEYDWGGTYYFMDKHLTISEHLFNYLIGQ